MKQVVVIHGGDSFSTYDEYIAFLRGLRVESAESFRPRPDWKANLQEALGPGYDVFAPRMPNKDNARYTEWSLWFEKLIPFLENGVVLIGHSLGGSFLAKYLSENKFPQEIAATLLVAAPFDLGGARAFAQFTPPASLTFLAAQSGRIFLYQSEDDPVVPFAELAKYCARLPAAIARVFPDRKHFNQPGFYEIVADIEAL